MISYDYLEQVVLPKLNRLDMNRMSASTWWNKVELEHWGCHASLYHLLQDGTRRPWKLRFSKKIGQISKSHQLVAGQNAIFLFFLSFFGSVNPT